MDILGSIKTMESLYGKALLDEDAKYGLPRNFAMKHSDLSYLRIYGAMGR